MKTHPATGKELIPPIWYALGSIFATPLISIFMVIGGLLFFCSWPFIPFLCYFQRKAEIRKANDQVELPPNGGSESKKGVVGG